MSIPDNESRANFSSRFNFYRTSIRGAEGGGGGRVTTRRRLEQEQQQQQSSRNNNTDIDSENNNKQSNGFSLSPQKNHSLDQETTRQNKLATSSRQAKEVQAEQSKTCLRNKQLGCLLAADLELLRLRNLRLNDQHQQHQQPNQNLIDTGRRNISVTSPKVSSTLSLEARDLRLLEEPTRVNSQQQQATLSMYNNHQLHSQSNQLNPILQSAVGSNYHQLPGESFGYGSEYATSFTPLDTSDYMQQSNCVDEAVGGHHSHYIQQQQQQQQQPQQQLNSNGFLHSSLGDSDLLAGNHNHFTLHCLSSGPTSSANVSSHNFNSSEMSTCDLLGLSDELSPATDDAASSQRTSDLYNSNATSTLYASSEQHTADLPLSYVNLEPASQHRRLQHQCQCRHPMLDSHQSNGRASSLDETSNSHQATNLLPDSVTHLNYLNSRQQQQQQQQHLQQQHHSSSHTLLDIDFHGVTATSPLISELNSQSESSSGCCSNQLLNDNSHNCNSNNSIQLIHNSAHLDLNSPSDEPELKVCEWDNCGNTFLDIHEFVKHLEERHVNQEPREKNRYYCLWSNCKRNEQEFNARYKLLIHMRVHSGEKPYPCNIQSCNKSFSRLENLKIHQRSHTGEKPYKCNFDGCQKSFTNSSDRIKHHKTHKDPKPYSCNYSACLKRYTDPSSLRKHLRAHKRVQQQQQTQLSSQPQNQLPLQQPYASNPSSQPCCPADYEPSAALFPLASPFQSQSETQTARSWTSAHAHFSRSWCAGASGRREGRSYEWQSAGQLEPSWRQPINANLEQQQHHSFTGHQQQQQHLWYNQQALQLTQMTSNHETLMRSLPPIRPFHAPRVPRAP